MGKQPFHAVKPWFSYAAGHSQYGRFHYPAHAVLLCLGGQNSRLHGFALLDIQRRKDCFGQCGNILFQIGKRPVFHLGAAADMCPDRNAQPRQCGQQNAACRYQRCSDPAGKVAAAPCVLIAMIFAIGSKVRMSGPSLA